MKIILLITGIGGFIGSKIGEKAIEKYVKLAKKNNISPSIFANAFVNSRPFVTSNIIGATSLDQLKETFSNEGFLAATGSFFDGVLANVPGYDTVKGFLTDSKRSKFRI